METRLVAVIITITLIQNAKAEVAVDTIQPRHGGMGGQVRLTIHGRDFPDRGTQALPGTKSQGTEVWLVSPIQQFPCTFDTDEVTPSIIICYTRPMPEGDYVLTMSVDGELVPREKLCKGNNWNCGHYVRSFLTPWIYRMLTYSGTPGSMLEMWGTIFTNKSDSASFGSANGNAASFRRVYIGDQVCALKEDDSDDHFGLNLDSATSSNGQVKCKVRGSTVANRNVSFILTGSYGRSKVHRYAYRESSDGKPYMYQTHAVVTSTSPKEGSTQGGTLLQIEGNYFDPTPGATKVMVGSKSCDVIFINDTVIRCRTPEDPGDTEFGGGRGILREAWNRSNINFDKFDKVKELNSSSPGYFVQEYPDFGWQEADPESRYNTRVRAYFIAPRDSMYTFYLAADDSARVTFQNCSNNGSVLFELQCPKYCYGQFHFNKKHRYMYHTFPETQVSPKVHLEKGQRLCIDALHYDVHSQSSLAVGVKIHSTKLNEYQAEHGHNERHRITVKTAMLNEKQSVRLLDWTLGSAVQEVQKIKTTLANQDAASDVSFRIGLYGAKTSTLQYGISAINLQRKLNQLPSLAPDTSVSVTRADVSGGYEYTVTFNGDRGDLPPLQVTKGPNSQALTSEVTESTKGASSGRKLYFDVAGASTPALPNTASAEQVAAALNSIVGAQCPSAINKGDSFFWGMEPHETNFYKFEGNPVDDTEPFCGRFSYKNPKFLYLVTSKHKLYDVDLSTSPYICFAYKGKIKNEVTISYTWVPQGGSRRTNTDNFPVTFINDEKWHYQCLDLKGILMAHRVGGSGFRLKYIKIYPTGPREEFFVDVIAIKKSMPVDKPEDAVEMRVPAAKPGGSMVKYFTVNKTSDNEYVIEMVSRYCGYNVPLLQLTNTNWPGQSRVEVTRLESASKPVGGSIGITYRGVRKTVPVTAKPEEIADELMTIKDMGVIKVTQEGNCSCLIYDIEFVDRPGDQDPPEIHSSSLTDFENSYVETLVDGGFMHDLIPGEMLQRMATQPQVSVFVNKIPSQVTGDASHQFSDSVTPTVTAINPTTGTGITVTITGTGFTETNGHSGDTSSVRLGNSNCAISKQTDTSIECLLSSSTYGQFKVDVTIKGKGRAAHPSGDKMFTIQGMVSGISPTSATKNGGTLLVISGKGLASVKEVTVEGQGCTIKSKNDTHVTCIVPKRQDGVSAINDVDVIVTTDQGALTSPTKMTYTTPLATAMVTGVTPTTADVWGGTPLMISGSNFGQQQGNSYVTVGDKVAKATSWADAEIVVNAPDSEPGTYNLVVNIADSGFAEYVANVPSSITYTLEVDSISPTKGSVFGGSDVTITGSGFPTDTNMFNISFGSVKCDTTEATSTKVTCQLRNSYKVHRITNQGITPGVGPGFRWDPPTSTIMVGDIVRWDWWVSSFVKDVEFGVHQTKNATTDELEEGGFTSGSVRTPKGSFQKQFWTEGINFFSSMPVDKYERFTLRGAIKVTAKPPAAAGEIKIFVGGKTPVLNPSVACADSYPGPVVEGCTTPEPTSNSQCVYKFWECLTPEVTSMSSLSDDSGSKLTISGKGFDTTASNNIVNIGNGYSCNVDSATSTEIVCTVDHKGTMPVNTALRTTLRVKNHGYPKMTAGTKMAFVLEPKVISISPSVGSLQGGTNVTLTGYGFTSSSGSMSVTIGTSACKVVSVSYTHIYCITSSNDSMQQRRKRATSSVSITMGQQSVTCSGSCSYQYSATATPTVTAVTPSNIKGSSTTLTITGTKFGMESNKVKVSIGDSLCQAQSVTDTQITCSVGPVVVGTQNVWVKISGLGLASVDSTAESVTVEPEITLMTPTTGSINGGTVVTISGGGFHTCLTSVAIGGAPCPLVANSPTISEVKCISPARAEGQVEVVVTSNSVAFPSQKFDYAAAATPTITSVSPTSGSGGDTLTVTGTGFSGTASDNIVSIGGTACNVTSSTTTTAECQIPSLPANTHDVTMSVSGKGIATSSATFTSVLTLTAVTPSEGSLAGGMALTLTGAGFDKTNMSVSVCDKDCSLKDDPTGSQAVCSSPMLNGTADSVCNVTVVVQGVSRTLVDSFTYRNSLTPEVTAVSPTRGGTGGGTDVTVTGTGFESSGNEVRINGVTCDIKTQSATQIICTTNASPKSVKTKVEVTVPGKGLAKLTNSDFTYVNTWSDPASWGNGPLPVAGDLVVIKDIILLDVDTPVMEMLLIQGGKLIFDDEKSIVILRAKKVLINDGGALQVGTREKPYKNKATIELYGHSRSQELPMYGTKVLAVRNGTLDLHGTPVITWTVLALTAAAGSNSVTLQIPVDWKVGDKIVIATTGTRHSQRETEVRTITAISSDKKTLTLDKALQYKHISEKQTLGSVEFETRAEVGLLTRNVVVKGNDDAQWHDDIPACPDGFDTGEFARQTCLQGRFGDEVGSDKFGAHIMVSSAIKDAELAIGRIEYTEVTHAGQAFRLGRYPIHFHLQGVSTLSYVKGCSIHHTFNRAINLHGTHGVVVEHNVAYDVMGGAFFLEDGIETGNTFQYNLLLFVKSSTSLLNDDITPAAFWITNPNNTVRHNHAAGGTHFGFWYRMHEHPDGPSFTNKICPQNVPVKEFYNNTVHSQGWFGIWIFENYHPRVDGHCNGPETHAVFSHFNAWNNEKGAEWVNCGSMQFKNFRMLNNEKAGIEAKLVKTTKPYTDEGPLISDSIIVGHLGITEGLDYCTNTGIVLPFYPGLQVKNVTFINFDRTSCTTLGVTSVQGKCSVLCGGYKYKFSKIKFDNSPNKAKWRWTHEGVLVDVDGSLTGGVAGRSVVPKMGILPSSCSKAEDFSKGAIEGFVCDPSVSYNRFSFNNVHPSSLKYKDVIVQSQHGQEKGLWAAKRVSHPKGWMFLLVSKVPYFVYFEDAGHITNTSYTGEYLVEPDDYIVMSTNVSETPDIVTVYPGSRTNGSSTPLDKAISQDGSWYYNAEEKKVEYIVSYTQNNGRKKRATYDPTSNLQNKRVHFQSLKCYYTDCIAPLSSDNTPPPLERPSTALKWSMSNADWLAKVGVPKPNDNEDVVIPKDKWIVVDVAQLQFRRLNISGVLELEYKNRPDTQKPYDIEITADVIIISGGRFIIGWPDGKDGPRRFLGKALIKLRGTHATKEFELPADMRGPPMGAKAMGVFGALEAWGKPHPITWSRLSGTVSPGSTSINLRDPVEWSVDDEIVIASSSFKTKETEVVKITAVSANKKTLTISPALKYRHLGKRYGIDGSYLQYDMAAEVGLLTRNIKITSDNVDIKESFGVRVVVGVLQQGDKTFTGYARLDNVEFNQAGQEGYTSPYDPRFQLTFIDTGTVSTVKPSQVNSCSFHNGFSPAIGVFSTKQLEIANNVIHQTVGGGIIAATEQLSILRNLVTKVLWPGTYNGRAESGNFDWDGGIDIVKSSGVTMKNNAVAGSERAGYRIYNRPCPISPTADDPWMNNVAHSVLTGVALFPDEATFGQCLYVHGIYVYKAMDYSFYIQGTPSIWFRNIMSADSKVGVYPMVVGPSAVDHKSENKFVRIEKSVFIGRSPDNDCKDVPDAKDNNYVFSSQARYDKNFNTFIGIVIATFSQSSNKASRKPWANIMAYPTIGGRMILEDITFANFNISCGARDYMIAAPGSNDDLIHPTKVSKVKVHKSAKESYVFFKRPNIGRINPSDCVDMDCDGLKNIIVKDVDGSFLGANGAVVSQSEFEWDGDRRRGLGDYRIPIRMLTDANGKRLAVADVAPNKGIIRNDQCTLMEPWQGYECHGIDYQMLIIESLDSDTETRRLSPLAVYNPSGKYVDLINGPQDHGWCSGYTCQKRLSTFSAVVATGKEFHLYFTGTNPQKMRLHLLNTVAEAVLLGVFYSEPQRLDVYVNNRLIEPKNAAKDAKGNTIYKTPSTPGEFKPTYSDRTGSNWFDPANKMIYVTIKGSVPVDIIISSMVIVDLSIPAMTVEEFFGEKIIDNLAKFLGLPASRIKITNIVRADGSRRKRAVSGDIIGVEIQISSPPPESIDDINATVLEAARAEMLNISEVIVTEAQTGSLGDKLNLTVLSAEIEEPLPPTDSTAWQDRVNNTGTQPILIPDKIKVVQSGVAASEGAPFSQPVAIEMQDASGTRVELLGSSTNPWKMAASLRIGEGSDSRAALVGDATVGFRMGWANFSTLSISHSGSGYMIDIVGIYPASSSKYSATVGPFNVSVKSLMANVSSQPTQVGKNSSFSLTVDVIDASTGAKVNDLAWKGHNWTCTLSLEGSDGYNGKLHSENLYVNPSNGSFVINKIALSEIGQTFIKVRVQSTPNDFDLWATSEAIDIEPRAKFTWQTVYKKVLKMRFDKDFSKLTKNKKRHLKALLKNKLVSSHQDVSFTNFNLTNGSILAEFTMSSGQRNVLESSAEKIAAELKSGEFSVDMDGDKMTADKTVWVDGQQQNDTNVTTAKSGGLSKGTIAAIVICVLIVVIVLVAIVAYCLCAHKKSKKVGVEKWAMTQSPPPGEKKSRSSVSLRSYKKVHPHVA